MKITNVILLEVIVEGDKMNEVLLDTLIDTLKLIPFLFLAFLLIEYMEHKLSKRSRNAISKAGRFGPFFGSLLGAIPQCGFSVMATNLYATRIVTLGTLIAIYLSTSDEMLPVLLSHQVKIGLVVKILLFKVVIGMFCGFIIDFLLRKKEVKKAQIDYSICDEEECDCKHGILKSTLKHTFMTTLFIFIISLILNIIMHFIGSDVLSKMFLKNSFFGSFITSLVGLIPNCGASVVITELYLKGAISFGSMIGGLLTGSGISLLVLFRVNRNIYDNLKILFLLYGIGVISGVVIDIIGLV